MTSTDQPRKPGGSPEGGQFAGKEHSDPGVELGAQQFRVADLDMEVRHHGALVHGSDHDYDVDLSGDEPVIAAIDGEEPEDQSDAWQSMEEDTGYVGVMPLRYRFLPHAEGAAHVWPISADRPDADTFQFPRGVDRDRAIVEYNDSTGTYTFGSGMKVTLSGYDTDSHAVDRDIRELGDLAQSRLFSHVSVSSDDKHAFNYIVRNVVSAGYLSKDDTSDMDAVRAMVEDDVYGHKAERSLSSRLRNTSARVGYIRGRGTMVVFGRGSTAAVAVLVRGKNGKAKISEFCPPGQLSTDENFDEAEAWKILGRRRLTKAKADEAFESADEEMTAWREGLKRPLSEDNGQSAWWPAQ